MSSCIGGLELVKPQWPSIRSSSPSSTLSESSNSSRAISTKRARTPRKRPNQSYTEAAALLSTVHPKVFSSKNLGKLCKHSRPYHSFIESSELLPTFPALADAGFLIHEQYPEKPVFQIEPRSVNSLRRSPQISDFRMPGSPIPLDDDFDADSILDEETEEGIDSIMGNVKHGITESVNYNSNTGPYFGGFGLGAKFELGLGFGLRGNLRRALRPSDDGDWWRSPTVAIRDIIPQFKALPPPSSSEKKKKKKKMDIKEVKASPTTAPDSSEENSRPLLLKLNYEEVVKEWSDREYPIPDADGSPKSSANALARLANIELFPEEEEEAGGGGSAREASVMRYKEKRRSRLFSKKIRYQVRKVNADRRPRMKASGRFVRRPELLQEAIEEECK